MTVSILSFSIVTLLIFIGIISISGTTGRRDVVFSLGILLISFTLALGNLIYREIIKSSCEETLPRNQECVIIAVPKDIQEN